MMLQTTQLGHHGSSGLGLPKFLQPSGTVKKLRPSGRNIFLRSPWAVKFLTSLDRKIHDALAEWSVITHYCMIIENYNKSKWNLQSISVFNINLRFILVFLIYFYKIRLFDIGSILVIFSVFTMNTKPWYWVPSTFNKIFYLVTWMIISRLECEILHNFLKLTLNGFLTTRI